MAAPDPGRLRELGKKLDELREQQAPKPVPHNQWGTAFRFVGDLVAGLFVGGGMGWGKDWRFGRFGHHTKPAFMIVFFVLGAAAGIRNVIRTAQELNAGNGG